MKTCTKCQKTKEDNKFHKNRLWCKKCFNHATRNAKYQKRYGISAGEADQMKESGCWVCGKGENLHIDHNHQTKEIRGVLCSSCNRGLGYFQDDPQLIEKALEYLNEKGYYGGR